MGYDASGVGFIWSHPDTAETPLYHDNEYGLEVVYVLQLTPTMKLQPDFSSFGIQRTTPTPAPPQHSSCSSTWPGDKNPPQPPTLTVPCPFLPLHLTV